MNSRRMRRWLAAFCLGVAGGALAQPAAPPSPGQGREQARELIYCADLMTHEEREAYRTRMRAAQTPQEREALREAHHRQMQERARQQGADQACEPRRARARWRGGQGR